MEIKVTMVDYSRWEGCDADTLLAELVERLQQRVGGTLNAESMARLSSEQLTLWGYYILREEVMDGGFVQLIYNGYGPFFFFNPFAKAMRLWGLPELAKLINKGKKLYIANEKELTKERTDSEFMALFEQFPAFDDLDDDFVEEEETFTRSIAEYVRGHLDLFVTPSAAAE